MIRGKEMTTQTTHDQATTEVFLGKVLGDTSGLTTTIMASIGDRLGLFRSLAESSATSAELAQRTSCDERYVREWLCAMTSAGYLTYDPSTARFTLPAAYRPVLVEESGPMFFGGIHQWVTALARQIEPLIQAFRDGGGIPQAAYDEITWDGQERFTNTWFESLLIPVWMPLMPEVHARLERGTTLADVGCGRGRAIVKLAQAYPNSHFVGYDVYGPSIEHARLLAHQAGVTERVRFQQVDASQRLPEQYDLITTFDVIHDAAKPRELLRSIRAALRPNGRYVCLEINAAETLEQNAGSLGSFLYGFSVLYCMTSSLAEHGEGLGTMGMPESKVRALCAQAGFSKVQRVSMENPFNSLYEVWP
jgi:2-polyprenyl-3-methyl-5-hydroxy-6-metoxy-1,4-benzoquinol methylase